MATHLTLLCHGTTRAMREGAFGRVSDPLDKGGLAKLARFRLDGPAPDLLLTSHALAARQTADHFGQGARVVTALADIDAGSWAGCSLDRLFANSPDAAAAWLAAPSQGTPDGETMQQVADRLRPWLDQMAMTEQRILAVSHAAVLRIAVALVLGAPLARAGLIDIAPMAAVRLSFNRVWRLQEIRAA